MLMIMGQKKRQSQTSRLFRIINVTELWLSPKKTVVSFFCYLNEFVVGEPFFDSPVN